MSEKIMQFNTDYIPPQSGTFRCIKVTLIVFQILMFVGVIILLVVGFMALGVADEEPATEQKTMRFGGGILIFASIIGMLIVALGLYGTLKENFNFVVAYAVILTISVIGGFASGNILGSILNLITAGIAFYYAYLINRVRGQNNIA